MKGDVMATNGKAANVDATIHKIADELQAIPEHPERNKSPRGKHGVIEYPSERVLYGDPMDPDTFAELLTAARVDPFTTVQPPPTLFNFKGARLLTAGNFSVISGKAKSRKSIFTAMIAALTINPHTERVGASGFEAIRPHERSGVLYFDTEQSEIHTVPLARRILWYADRETTPADQAGLHVFQLAQHSSHDRLMFMDAAIRHYADTCSLVVIDGLRDVLLSINTEEEATFLTQWLLQITKRYNIHLLAVLHENKGNDQLRGHIGTEAQNKAEAVFVVQKGKGDNREHSGIDTPMCRNKSIDPVAMTDRTVDAFDGTLYAPVLVDDGTADKVFGTSTARDKASPSDVNHHQHMELATEVMRNQPPEGATIGELVDSIKVHGPEIIGQKVTRDGARDFVTYWHEIMGIVTTNGKATNGRRYLPDGTLADELKPKAKQGRIDEL